MKKPVKIVLVVLAILIVGVGLGAGSVIVGMNLVGRASSISSGAWQTNLFAGSEKADPYLRLSTAVRGLLALSQSETIYYGASRDSDGNPLSANCTYRIEGKAPDARWWSVTAYDERGFLFPNVSRFSYNMNDLTPDSQGVYTIYVSRTPHSGAWLPLGEPSRFSLTLRLYNPGQSVRNGPGTVDLPRIVLENCK
jgi:hypothetical protein